MVEQPEKAKESILRTYRWPAQLVGLGVAGGLWLSGLASGLTALIIICLPAAVLYNYGWLSRALRQAPQK
jgi:hypothetical protein